MTKEQKIQIKSLIAKSVNDLGGQRPTATKVGASAATISQILNDKWDLISNEMWSKIGAKLGYVANNGWKLVSNIFNMRVIETTFLDAKNNSMMMCVSHKAGSGKTAGSKVFLDKYSNKQVYYIHCREWTAKQFLTELRRTLGIEQPHGYATAHELLSDVVEFFLVRAGKKPLLIVDEADKLKASALRAFIPLYNSTEDQLGIVLMGTENLSSEIKRGVRFNKKGFDEIDSRLGRQYVRLYGANKRDVQAICAANGITSKTKQNEIWTECQPKEVTVGGQFLKMIDDLRRLKRVVQRELIKSSEILN